MSINEAINIQTTSINAITPTTGAISIGASQTNGILNLGAGGSRTATGAINIGTGGTSNPCIVNIANGGITQAGSVNIANSGGATISTVVNIANGSSNGGVSIGNPAGNVTLGGASILIANNSVGGTVQIKNSSNSVGEVQIVTSGGGTNTTPVKISTGTTTGTVSIGNISNTTTINSGITNIKTGVGTLALPLAGTVNIATGTGAGFVTTAVNIGTGSTTGVVTIGNTDNSIALNAPTTVKSIKDTITYFTTQTNTLTVAQILESNFFGSTYSSANPTTTNDIITINLPTPTSAMEGMSLTFRKVRGSLNNSTTNWSFACPTSSIVPTSLTAGATPTLSTQNVNSNIAKFLVMVYSGTYYYFNM